MGPCKRFTLPCPCRDALRFSSAMGQRQNDKLDAGGAQAQLPLHHAGRGLSEAVSGGGGTAGTGVRGRRVRPQELAGAAFRYDPGSVLHGVFLEKLAGVARLQRCLSGFVEARDSAVADSGGVKNDRVAASPKALQEIGLKVGAVEGFGNVPFHRTEYTAKSIVAYFNLDLAQLRAYGLGESAQRFLITLALWKVRRFLETGLRLRTACDLDLDGALEVTRPREGFNVPTTAALEADLPALISACAAEGLFADPPVTRLKFQRK